MCGRRWLSAGDVRSRSDDRRQRIIFGRARVGASGDRAKSFRGRFGRGGDALGISGTVDFREADDAACLARIRSIVEKWGYRRQSCWDRKKPVEPALAAEEIYGIYDSSPARPYDMKEILARVLDGSRFDEYKPEYGKTLICGYGRIGGFAVGIVANQKMHAQATDHEGHKRTEFGGVIYTESAEKAARFIMDCNQNLDSAGFLPRRERLHGGTRRRVERHHQSWREDGERRFELRGAEDHCDCRRFVRRWTLCDVRQSV